MCDGYFFLIVTTVTLSQTLYCINQPKPFFLTKPVLSFLRNSCQPELYGCH